MRSSIVILLLISIACSKKPEDRFIDIRGRRQHLIDMGEGIPVVVFVNGFGDRARTWMHVQPKVAKLTRTISYDRPGLGESEALSANRSLDTLVFELNQILQHENAEAPYVLVGHSMGGHIVRYFSHLHPDKVAGIVLVDATVEYMEDEFKRLKGPDDARKYDSLKVYGRDPNWPEGIRSEADYFEENNNKIKSIGFARHIPTTVITGMNMPESSFSFMKGVNDIKVTLHQRWVSEYPHIRHIFANASGHFVQHDEPQLVVDEILAIVERHRQVLRNKR